VRRAASTFRARCDGAWEENWRLRPCCPRLRWRPLVLRRCCECSSAKMCVLSSYQTQLDALQRCAAAWNHLRHGSSLVQTSFSFPTVVLLAAQEHHLGTQAALVVVRG